MILISDSLPAKTLHFLLRPFYAFDFHEVGDEISFVPGFVKELFAFDSSLVSRLCSRVIKNFGGLRRMTPLITS